MIEQKLIEDICRNLRVDDTDVKIALRNCKLQGYMGIHELHQFSNSGIPIGSIIPSVLRTNIKELRKYIENKSITYGDVCIALGVFAQDLLIRIKR